MFGPTFDPVAYLSKRLNLTATDWAPYLRILAAAFVLIQESKELCIGGPTEVLTPHLSELLTYKGMQTLQPWLVLALQTALIEDSSISFNTCPPLNPSTLLPLPSNIHTSISYSCF